MTDVAEVGGKNASLGEMIGQLSATGVRVPGGFATTADAYRVFLAHNGLADRINRALDSLDVNDVDALVKTGAQIRQWVVDTPLPANLEAAIKTEYEALIASSGADASFAVRSSATAEDLPDASFAGQQESFLNIHGYENILHAIKEVFASISTMIAPLLTVSTRDLPMRMWHSPPVSSAWCVPIRERPG